MTSSVVYTPCCRDLGGTGTEADQTLIAGHDEPDDDGRNGWNGRDGRICRFPLLLKGEDRVIEDFTADKSQGMMGGGLGSGAYGVSWLPPWMQTLIRKSSWYW